MFKPRQVVQRCTTWRGFCFHGKIELMIKRLSFYCVIGLTIALGVFFGVKHQADAVQGGAFNSGSYCVANTTIPSGSTSSAQDVLSFINYGSGYSVLPSDEQAKVQQLLSASAPQDSSGLVPCGRQCDDPTTVVNEAVPCNFCHIFVLFHNIVNTLLKWALLIAILFVAAGGFLIMTAGASGSGHGTAGKKMISSALTGYAIMLSAWIIVNLFFSLIGVASWVGIGNWWQPDCPVDQTPGLSISAGPLNG